MYKQTTLDNGLRVLSVTMPHVQSVGLGFFLAVGSRYESAPLSGASHFIEHMLFKGAARYRSALEIADAIEAKGGVLNASTSLETTTYWVKAAADHLPGALDVLSDMLLSATFDPAELHKERAVISEEIKYAWDAPDILVQLRSSELQWPDHPLGRDISGSQESVAGMSRDALLTYQADHYHPERTVLGLAGRLDHAQVVSWAESYLSDWEPGEPASWEPAPSGNARGPLVHVEAKDTAQAQICLTFTGLSREHPDRYALRLLNVILGEGMRSRLFQEVREQLGLAYSIGSYVTAVQDAGSVGIDAGVAIEMVHPTIEAILGQLDQLRREPVPMQELDKAKEFSRGRLALSFEESLAVAAWYAQQEIHGLDVLEPEQVLARLQSVAPADILRVAQTVFKTERAHLAVVGPFQGQEDSFRQALRS